jgi:KaiC/GvpD/RAD55 family RecA-like ATPase
MGIRRRDRRLVQHNACCFGINHWRYVNSHQLYMIDATSEEDPSEALLLDEKAVSTSEESMQNEVSGVKKKEATIF